MKPRLLCIAACAALMSGCMNLQPGYERPAAPVAAAFAHDAAAGGAPASETPWQTYFAGDARLAALIDLALRQNRDLRVAILNIDSARALVDVRRADQYPTVAAALAGTRQPGANGRQTSLYTAGLTVSAYELDLFGRVRSLTDAALAQYLATEEARRAAQIALVASVANVYYASRADEDLLDLTRSTLQTRDESLRLTQLKFDHGATSELDLRLAQSLVEAARVALAQQQRQRELDENALVLLVGQPLSSDALPQGRAWKEQDLADVPARLPSEVLLRRPDVRQAEQQLVAANANIGAARAAFWPRISLTASFGTASSELDHLFQGRAWTFAPQLVMPLFDAGRNRANLRIAQVQRDVAVAQYERSIQAAFRDVADALAGRVTLDEQVRAVRAQADAERGRFRLSELRFKNGVASSLELLDAQRSLFAVQQAQLQTELALLQNKVTLYRVLGGGWKDADAH